MIKAAILFTILSGIVFVDYSHSGDFSDNHDGTVIDNVTGMIWQKTSIEELSLELAINYCEDLTLGESSDWRVPDIKELASLLDDESPNSCLDQDLFANNCSAYWSSTTHPAIINNRIQRLVIQFSTAWITLYANLASSPHFVRCVRGPELE
jgi:hypothetical protein